MDSARRERIKDLVLGFVLAAIGIGGFLFINPTGAAVTEGPGGLSWRTLPFIYSGLLLLLVAFFLASTLFDFWLLSKGEPPRSLLGERPEVKADPLSDRRRVMTLICITAYAASLGAFGFAISTFVLLFVMFRILGRTELMRNALIALVGTVLLWVLFIGLLKLPISGNVWDPVTPWLNKAYQMTGAR